jgi:hypothetical protein
METAALYLLTTTNQGNAKIIILLSFLELPSFRFVVPTESGQRWQQNSRVKPEKVPHQA